MRWLQLTFYIFIKVAQNRHGRRLKTAFVSAVCVLMDILDVLIFFFYEDACQFREREVMVV